MKNTEAYRFDSILPVTRAVEQLHEYDDEEIHHVEVKITPVGGGVDD